jgi:hypothetical protein
MQSKDDDRRRYGTFTHPGRYAHLACGGRYYPIDPAFNVLGTCESPKPYPRSRHFWTRWSNNYTKRRIESKHIGHACPGMSLTISLTG